MQQRLLLASSFYTKEESSTGEYLVLHTVCFGSGKVGKSKDALKLRLLPQGFKVGQCDAGL